MTAGPIRILVADDSAFSRVTLSRIIEKDPALQVVGTATNGEEAIRLTVARRPDLITLDLEMPGLDGFAVLRWLAANRPTPAIVVSSRGRREDVFRALELGAVDFVVKPQPHASPEYRQLEGPLLEKIRGVAGAHPARAPVVMPPVPESRGEAPRMGVVIVGASTGGPPAVGALLASLPRLPVPLVVAQHMPAGFTSLLAQRVARNTAYPVVEAKDGERLAPGWAYVVPGGSHGELAGSPVGLRLRVLPRAAEDYYAPSIDRLMGSAVKCAAPLVVAAILTGMGSDGRDGLLALRRSGGRTIAESEETAVVFGMPREAIEAGAAEQVLPLPEIPVAVARLVGELPDLSDSPRASPGPRER